MASFYALEVQKENLAGELRLNDVPLYSWRDTRAITKGQPVNMWITGRSGRVTLTIDWRMTGGAQGPPNFQCRVMTGTNRTQPAREAREVASLRWPPGPNAPRQDRVTLEFSVDDPPPSALWAEAQLVEAGPETSEGVMAVLRYVNDALDRKDIPGAAGYLQYKTLDVGRSMYHDDRTSASGLREFLEFSMEGPGWGMEPVNDDSIQLQTVADGRLIWATRKGLQPALQSLQGRRPQLQLPVYVAAIEGRWTIAR